MPTVASSAPPHPLPPGDADLQELYDQVLSAFAEESSPSNFSPTFSMSRPNNIDHDSPHSDEAVGSQISSRPNPQSRGQSIFPLLSSFSSYLSASTLVSASSRDNNRPVRSPTAFSTSPVLGKSPRPLPRLPPTASPNSPPHYPAHMPEPDPVPPTSTGTKPYAEPCVILQYSPSFSCHPCV
jgi:hypothetical protein